MHTFVAGQKYGVGRDATRRCCFLYSEILKTKQNPEPGGCAPRLRLTLLLAQKSKQKSARAALGIDVRMISVISNGFCVGEPARTGVLTALLS